MFRAEFLLKKKNISDERWVFIFVPAKYSGEFKGEGPYTVENSLKKLLFFYTLGRRIVELIDGA